MHEPSRQKSGHKRTFVALATQPLLCAKKARPSGPSCAFPGAFLQEYDPHADQQKVMPQVFHEKEPVAKREAAEQEIGLLTPEKRLEIKEPGHVIEELKDTVISVFTELAVNEAQ
ncbi:MAG TPA: hypothetical protein VMT95_09680 [Candidatus Binatia bacterium]|nr:hypothetical protein [Candidatus Binatia bacterium]